MMGTMDSAWLIVIVPWALTVGVIAGVYGLAFHLARTKESPWSKFIERHRK